MKILAVETVIVNARLRNWVFVKVVTDDDGFVGWGEATLEWKTRAVVGAEEDLATIVVEQDPRQIEHLWQSMMRDHYFKGGVVTMSAIPASIRPSSRMRRRTNSGEHAVPSSARSAWIRRYPYVPSESVKKWRTRRVDASRRAAVADCGRDNQW